MRAEVMEYYGLLRSPRAVGYYETAHHRQLLQDVKQAVYDGDLVALCGVVGAGKTAISTNLGVGLAMQRPGRVVVVDLDDKYDIELGARVIQRVNGLRQLLRDPRFAI